MSFLDKIFTYFFLKCSLHVNSLFLFYRSPQNPRDQCIGAGGGRDRGGRGCILLPWLREARVAVGGGAGGVGGGVSFSCPLHVCLHGEWKEE